MKVGYSFNANSLEALEKICEKIVIVTETKFISKRFTEFIEENLDNDLYMLNLKDSGLQLIQLAKGLELLRNHGKYITFINEPINKKLTPKEFTDMLCEIGLLEKELIITKTQNSVHSSDGSKMPTGRPSINPSVVEEIQRQYLERNKTLREIAINCNVSLGTAFKYAVTLNSQVD